MSKPKSEKQTRAIASTAGKDLDAIDRIAKLYQDAFRDDPAIVYMLCKFSAEERQKHLYYFFRTLMKAAALNDGVFEQRGDWKSCSVLMLPHHYADNFWTLLPAGLPGAVWNLGFKGCKRMLFECAKLSDAARKRLLPKGQGWFYIWFLATAEDSRGEGLGSELVKTAQGRARKAKLTLWLEASTKHSRDLYLHLGFQVVDFKALGQGHTGADGCSKKCGKGVPIWVMVWPAQEADNTEEGRNRS
ncbi:Acetyltransferase (GNAT) domain-containing protein 1 [Elsinoe fawcettii]|nr:Acetyltransferase (GNAT) domain-containing protein 1 [Elsinoe fawcettii]